MLDVKCFGFEFLISFTFFYRLLVDSATIIVDSARGSNMYVLMCMSEVVCEFHVKTMECISVLSNYCCLHSWCTRLVFYVDGMGERESIDLLLTHCVMFPFHTNLPVHRFR